MFCLTPFHQVIFSLIHHMHRLAVEHGEQPALSLEGDWEAYPLVVSEPNALYGFITFPLIHDQEHCLQDNFVDCGVWILACMTAVLQGYTSVSLGTQDLEEYRRRLLALVYTNTHVI